MNKGKIFFRQTSYTHTCSVFLSVSLPLSHFFLSKNRDIIFFRIFRDFVFALVPLRRIVYYNFFFYNSQSVWVREIGWADATAKHFSASNESVDRISWWKTAAKHTLKIQKLQRENQIKLIFQQFEIHLGNPCSKYNATAVFVFFFVVKRQTFFYFCHLLLSQCQWLS